MVFSAIALDKDHKTGGGGAVGLTNNPSALRRWMVAGLETARMVEEIKKQVFLREDITMSDSQVSR